MVSIVFTEKWEMSDVALKTKDSDQLLHVNKAVLAVHSPFFNTLLFSDSFTESKQDVVNVDGIGFWPMLEILRIIHNVDRNCGFLLFPSNNSFRGDCSHSLLC